MAQAAAYQAIGLASAEWHDRIDDRLNRLFAEGFYSEAVARWTLSDWLRMERAVKSAFRLFETVALQVEQDLLPEDALERLGYDWEGRLGNPRIACIWPSIAPDVGASARELFEAMTPAEDRIDCPD